MKVSASLLLLVVRKSIVYTNHFNFETFFYFGSNYNPRVILLQPMVKAMMKNSMAMVRFNAMAK